VRHATTTLFAALEVATGKATDTRFPRDRYTEFLDQFVALSSGRQLGHTRRKAWCGGSYLGFRVIGCGRAVWKHSSAGVPAAVTGWPWSV